MTETDWHKFVELMQGADEVTTGSRRTDTALKLMFAALKQYDIRDIGKAILACIETHKYSTALKPADIIEKIAGRQEDRSAIAWRLFLSACDRHGYYDSVTFNDPAMHYTIQQLGGWLKLSQEYMNMTDRERAMREKGWREMYEIGLRVADETNTAASLPGFFEIDNRSRGFQNAIPTPVNVIAANPISRPFPAPTLGQGDKVHGLKKLGDNTSVYTDNATELQHDIATSLQVNRGE